MESLCPILDRPTGVQLTPYCRESWSIVRCLETGFVFLHAPPQVAQLQDEFAWEKTSSAERQRRLQDEPVAARISQTIKHARQVASPNRNKIASMTLSIAASMPSANPLRILDVGCGTGSLMVELHNRCTQMGRSMVPIGIEVSTGLAAASASVVTPLGGHVIPSNAIEGVRQLEKQSIDVAVMSSFLEHESRPLVLLRELSEALTATGAIVLKVPNFSCWNRHLRGRKWCGFRFPDHVNYFTPRTLRRLANEAGFRLARQRLRDRSPLSDNMYAVLVKP